MIGTIDTGLHGVPEDWELTSFGKCAEIVAGQSPKGDTYNTGGEGIPLLNGPAEFGARTPTAVQWTSEPTKFAQKDDVLFCVRGNTTGRMNIADGAYCIGRRLAAIRQVEGKTTTPFVYFLLCLLRSSIYAIATAGGSTFPNISKSTLSEFEVGLPPLPEQKKIAHILSTVQRAIEAQERIIQTTTELKKALMHKLFTEGLRNEPQKQTEIGPIPESWEVVGLEAKAESFQYGTSVKCGYDVEGKAVLRIPNVVGGYVAPADLKFGKPKPNELGKLKLESGDLLFVRTNGVKENAGRCSKFNDELDDCYFASYLIRVRLDPAVLNPDFLNEYSRTEVGTSFLSGKAIRTADRKFNINSGTLKTMLVPVPAIEEQEEIAQALSLIDDKAANTAAKKAQLQDLFRTLLHELMTAKTRVHAITVSAIEGNS